MKNYFFETKKVSELIRIYCSAIEEKEGLLNPTVVKVFIGKRLSITEIFSSLITGFLIGFKGIEAILYYADLVSNPQDFMLSSRGNMIGGLLIAIISIYLKWKENEKTQYHLV